MAKVYTIDDLELNRQLSESRQYRAIIERVSALASVEQSLIWAIGSRESAWGLTLKPRGPGGSGDHARRVRSKWGALPPDGHGWGRGLMQIDYASHEFARTGDWKDPEANITYAIREVLLGNVRYAQRFAGLSTDAKVRAAVAGYNCGMGNVAKLIRSGERDVDKLTSHKNYSADVIERGKWFVARGEWVD